MGDVTRRVKSMLAVWRIETATCIWKIAALSRVDVCMEQWG